MKVIHMEENEAHALLLALKAAKNVCEAVGALTDRGMIFPGPTEPAAPRINRGIRLLEEELGTPEPALGGT